MEDIKKVRGAVGRLVRKRVTEGVPTEDIIAELSTHEVEEKYVRNILEDIANEWKETFWPEDYCRE